MGGGEGAGGNDVISSARTSSVAALSIRVSSLCISSAVELSPCSIPSTLSLRCSNSACMQHTVPSRTVRRAQSVCTACLLMACFRGVTRGESSSDEEIFTAPKRPVKVHVKRVVTRADVGEHTVGPASLG